MTTIAHPTRPEAQPRHEPRSATLLVFTLGARWETRRRQLLPSNSRRLETALHRACLENVFAAGRATRSRLLVASPSALELPDDASHVPQSGPCFGSRLARAHAEARAATPDGQPVVMVGSDVPGLGAEHLQQTLESLSHDPNRVVIGPSPDGGFYLLASNRPLDHLFASVRWCCRHTLRSLRRALRKDGFQVTLLPALRDLDGRGDLQSILASSHSLLGARWRTLADQLLRALTELFIPPFTRQPVLCPAPRRAIRGRAPPRHLAS